MMKGKNGGNESIFCVKAQIFSNMNSLNNDSLAVGSAWCRLLTDLLAILGTLWTEGTTTH